MKIEIIDNFLPNYYFKQLQSRMLGEYMPWFHNEYIATEDQDKKFQFVHRLYDIAPEYNGEGGIYSLIKDPLDLIRSKLKVTKLYRIKANLRPKSFFNRYELFFAKLSKFIFL